MQKPAPEKYDLNEFDITKIEEFESKFIKNDKLKQLFTDENRGYSALICFVVGIILATVTFKYNHFLDWLFSALGFYIGTMIVLYGIIYPFLILFRKIFRILFNPYYSTYKKLKPMYDKYEIALNNYNDNVKYELERFKKEEERKLIEERKQLEEERLNIIRKKKEYWNSLDGWEFEEEIKIIYEKQGYQAKLTSYSADGGIDIKLKKDNKYYIVQCKAHKAQLGPSVIRELYGTMISEKANGAILATLEGVSSKAKEFAKNKPIKILTIDEIIEMHELTQNF